MSTKVVDLYAGPGGWDEGMRSIGITDVIGIEIEPNACATAEAAGHKRLRADVSAVTITDFAGAEGLVASPPCQAWSMAGKRAGEVDRAKVHALIDAYAAGSDDIGAGWADDRSHHAAQPVRWVRELRPEWVCFEQVPPVLGLWQHTSDVLRQWGYSTWCGVLNSADYGVPQTRERAVLMASRTRRAGPPAATYTKDQAGADLFGTQLKQWVSMNDALGWGMDGRPSFTVTAGGASTGGAEPWPNNAQNAMRREASSGRWVQRSNYSAGGPGETAEERGRTIRQPHEPSVTLTGRPPQWEDGKNRVRISVAEAAILQTFPADYPWQGTKGAQFLQVGNAIPPKLAAAIVRAVTL